jgi:hypothetical protein
MGFYGWFKLQRAVANIEIPFAANAITASLLHTNYESLPCACPYGFDYTPSGHKLG